MLRHLQYNKLRLWLQLQSKMQNGVMKMTLISMLTIC